MRGWFKPFLTTVVLVALFSSLAFSYELSIQVQETTDSRYTTIEYEEVTYRIYTNGLFSVTLSRFDEDHVMMKVKPLEGKIQPYHVMYVQWGLSYPVEVPLEGLQMGGNNGFLLGSETGYAEK